MTSSSVVASAQRQREVVDEIWLVGLNKGDLSIADKHLTPDFRNHGSHDDSLTGPESFKLTIAKQRSAFSDIRYEILDFVSQGDRACVRWVMHGRHTGEFIGVAPTDKVVEHHAILILRFEGDKVAERWGIVDNFGLLRQLRGGGPGGPGSPGGPGPGGPGGPGRAPAQPAMRLSNDAAPAQPPAGVWAGSVTYEGKRDDYTIRFRDNGLVDLTTNESSGVGSWALTGNGSFRYSVREMFTMDPSGAPPAKVLPGAAYVQIDITATREGAMFSGSGTAEIRGHDGRLIHQTRAETVARQVSTG